MKALLTLSLIFLVHLSYLLPLPPVPQESKVDLALWGHHHSYQRTCRVYREACVDEGGVIHVVIGMAGAGLSQNIELVGGGGREGGREEKEGFTIMQLQFCFHSGQKHQIG